MQERIEIDLLYSEIIAGLSLIQKKLPCKLFYDEYGSKLFDQICEVEEYYPTRTEISILQENLDEIISFFDERNLFIELGSGSSIKTKLLLNRLEKIAGYVPIDISETHLLNTANKLRNEFPKIDIFPCVNDYNNEIKLPSIEKSVSKRIVFFPGSTIGNFTKEESKKFLSSISGVCLSGGGLLIGIDLIKNASVLNAAYNDTKGITAKFNLNVLARLNSEYNSNFNLEKFEHYAFFNENKSRVEMHLRSMENQKVKVGDRTFIFSEGETILTEYSHKFSIESFQNIIEESFVLRNVWQDDKKYFAVLYLEAI